MSRTVSLAGFKIHDTVRASFCRFLNRRIVSRQPVTVCFANANLIVKCRRLLDHYPSVCPSIIILNDGLALAAAARARKGFRFRENMNGTDLTPRFLEGCPPNTRLFLYGGTKTSVEGAAQVFAGYPNLHVVGAIDGYSTLEIANLNQTRPDVLLVAMGNPLQEEWLLRNHDNIDAPVRVAVGALFDFMSGQARRAPETIRRLHLEWAYRLVREPRRLLRRYTIDTLFFFWLVIGKS